MNRRSRQIKAKYKILFIFLMAGVIFLGFRYAAQEGWIKTPAIMASLVPQKAELPTNIQEVSLTGEIQKLPFPSTELTNLKTPEIKFAWWFWNSQLGAAYANGGAKTTKGSIMANKNVNLTFIRQDNISLMQSGLIDFANELANGKKFPKSGYAFVAIMLDGSAQFLAAVNSELKKLGGEYIAEIIGSCGYSRGEDKLEGPPIWKRNPLAMRGSLISGVLRDGDWNIAMKFIGDNSSKGNEIRNNPDEKTYDPDAVNWYNAADYIEAAQKYNEGYCEDREIVKSGMRTGKIKRVCLTDNDSSGVVTWTPGDVNIVKGRGGLVSIVSTREYRYQMANAIIGIKKFNEENHVIVENMLEGIFTGGEQVKNFPDAFDRAAEAAVDAFGTNIAAGEDAEYIKKYYVGTVETDKKGLDVELGGSTVNNLADNMQLFGLLPNSTNIAAKVYRLFGDIVVQQYPQLVPNYPPAEEVINSSYIKNIAARSKSIAKPDLPKFVASSTPITNKVSSKSWRIRFNTGQATFTLDALDELNKLCDDLLVAGSLQIEIDGHTDNVGSDETNIILSLRRATAVKEWLQRKAPMEFTEDKFRKIGRFGASRPIASNNTEEGRSLNRRVDIILGN